MSAEPLVSVLIPAFNAEATLAETLASALASSNVDLEVIVVDDGSTDRTFDIVSQIAALDPRVRPLRQPHRGVSAALNHGLTQVRGNYVARLDADDLWHPSKLEKQLRLIESDSQIGLVYNFVRYVDRDGELIRDAPRQELPRHAVCHCLYEGIIGGGSSVLVRRSAIQDPWYDERLAVWEDLLMHLHVTVKSRTAFVPEYLTAYRVRPSSSSSNRLISLENWRRARRRIRADFPQIPDLVHRWSDARRLLEFAQAFAFDGRPMPAASLLSQALALDFTRGSAYLGYLLHRRIARGRMAAERQGLHFLRCDPVRGYVPPDLEGRSEGQRFRDLDAARYRLLAQLGDEMAADKSS